MLQMLREGFLYSKASKRERKLVFFVKEGAEIGKFYQMVVLKGKACFVDDYTGICLV